MRSGTGKAWLLAMIIVSSGVAGGSQAQGNGGRASTCPNGSWLNVASGVCVPVQDRRLTTRAAAPGILPPDLAELRASKGGRSVVIGDDTPVPGGIGSGINYDVGSLQALQSADLQTTMLVHPEGLNASQAIDDLFTTATNRTERTIELVGWYYGTNTAYIALWDWSCTVAEPCQNSSTGPSWQWAQAYSNFTCNLDSIVDQGGHSHQAIRYSNSSVKEDSGSPPLWRNRVLFWNFCNSEWDLIYEHAFRADQRDCSVDNACGWWGPILETFNVIPEIAELGFEDSVLIHDGTTSFLPAGEATLSAPHDPCTGAPGGVCWEMCHSQANGAYGVGNDCTLWGCPDVPAGDCSSAGKSGVSLKRSSDPARQAFSWKWSKGLTAATQSDFGDPVSGDSAYRLCVYTESGGTPAIAMGGLLPAGGTCAGRNCWKAVATSGWSYKDGEATPAGFAKAVLKGGAAGKPSIKLTAKGSNLSLPAPASGTVFFDADSVLVQLHRADAVSGPGCWQSTFDVAGAKRNSGEQFTATAP